MTKDLNDLLKRASQPMIRLLGGIAAKLKLDNVETLLAWDKERRPIEERVQVARSAPTMEEWIQLNRDLGTPLLQAILISREEESAPPPPYQGVGACFGDADEDMQDVIDRHPLHTGGERATKILLLREKIAKEQNPVELTRLRLQLQKEEQQDAISMGRELLKMTDNEQRFAPAWVFHVMGDATFQRWMSVDALSAIEMAHAHVRRIPGCRSFTLKELLCSEDVRDNFATLVAYQYLSMPTTDTHTLKDGRGGRSRGTTYMNAVKLRESLGELIYHTAIWFEISVRAVPNPLVARFTAWRAEQEARVPVAQREAWTRKMDMFAAMLPKRELRYVG